MGPTRLGRSHRRPETFLPDQSARSRLSSGFLICLKHAGCPSSMFRFTVSKGRPDFSSAFWERRRIGTEHVIKELLGGKPDPGVILVVTDQTVPLKIRTWSSNLWCGIRSWDLKGATKVKEVRRVRPWSHKTCILIRKETGMWARRGEGTTRQAHGETPWRGSSTSKAGETNRAEAPRPGDPRLHKMWGNTLLFEPPTLQSL